MIAGVKNVRPPAGFDCRRHFRAFSAGRGRV